jgi:hypothetical protein
MASFQQPHDFFLALLAVVVSTSPIVDTVRFIPQETVDKSFGPLGFDEGYKSPDSEIVWGAVHVLATRELGAFPTPPGYPWDFDARTMKGMLEDKNYPLVNMEVPEGHSWGQWRSQLDDLLIYFFNPPIATFAGAAMKVVGPIPTTLSISPTLTTTSHAVPCSRPASG